MKKIHFNIERIKKSQADELIQNLNSVEGLHARHYTFPIEIKEALVPLVLEITKGITKGVTVMLISYYLIKFFEKEKSKDEQPIIINQRNIQIVQGESLQQVENKVNMIIEKKR